MDFPLKRHNRNIVDILRQRSVRPCSSLLQEYTADRLSDTDRLYCRDLKGHFGCVNALCFSHNDEEYLASGGDDMRILVWRMGCVSDGSRMPTPFVLKTSHHSNIFTLSFSCDDSYIFSAGNDGLILTYDARRGDAVQTYQHIGPVYSVNAHPSSPRILSAATDDGSIYLIDSRAPKLQQEMVVEDSIHSYHSTCFNPAEPHLLATGNEVTGAALHDLRKWEKVLTYKSSFMFLPFMKRDIMSVEFNSNGTKLCVLQKSDPPKIFNTLSAEPEFIFEDDTNSYRNSVTMKSACFAGARDQYVVTGSDDFRVYWWKLSLNNTETEDNDMRPLVPHLVIPGHKSIVNQTRYSKTHQTLISSGVEKFVKAWTAFPLHANHSPFLSRQPPVRNHYSYFDLFSMAQSNDEVSDTSLDSESMEESTRALAFFDQLIREEDITSSTSSESDEDDSFIHGVGHLFHHIFDSSHSDDELFEGIHLGMHSSSFDSFGDEDSISSEQLQCANNCTCVQVVPESEPGTVNKLNSNSDTTKPEESKPVSSSTSISNGVADSLIEASGNNNTKTDSCHPADVVHVTLIAGASKPSSSATLQTNPSTIQPSSLDNSRCSSCSSPVTFRNTNIKHTRSLASGHAHHLSSIVSASSQEHTDSLKLLTGYFTKKTSSPISISSGSCSFSSTSTSNEENGVSHSVSDSAGQSSDN